MATENAMLLAAIRAKCLECCCGSRKEVQRCTFTKCALHPYRVSCEGSRPRKEIQGQMNITEWEGICGAGE